jgi:hypothetical protein
VVEVATVALTDAPLTRDDDDARRTARRRGALVGLLVALVIAGLQALTAWEVVIDAQIGLLGAIPALICGWWLGPRASAPALQDAWLTVPAMALGVILIADALVVGLLAGPGAGHLLEDPVAILVVPYAYIWGLVLVGIPMLMVSVPAGVAWLAILRLWR